MTSLAPAPAIIDRLGLIPHREGGWFRETWRAANLGRPTGTAILFLLERGQVSHWHSVNATEIWLWHAGAPLVLATAARREGPATDLVLGPDVMGRQMPQLVIEAGHWQSARSLGSWTLVSCIVSPGFSFDGFTLAQPGFDIPRS